MERGKRRETDLLSIVSTPLTILHRSKPSPERSTPPDSQISIPIPTSFALPHHTLALSVPIKSIGEVWSTDTDGDENGREGGSH